MEEENKLTPISGLIPISDQEQRKEPSNTQQITWANTAANSQRNRRRSNTFEYFSQGLEKDQADQVEFRKELERATERKRQSHEKKNYIFKNGDKDYLIIYKPSQAEGEESRTKVEITQTIFWWITIKKPALWLLYNKSLEIYDKLENPKLIYYFCFWSSEVKIEDDTPSRVIHITGNKFSLKLETSSTKAATELRKGIKENVIQNDGFKNKKVIEGRYYKQPHLSVVDFTKIAKTLDLVEYRDGKECYLALIWVTSYSSECNKVETLRKEIIFYSESK